MKLLILIALAFALHAEDAQPSATIEQLQAKVAEQQKQIAEQAAELRLYQQGLFQCQAAQIHQQAVSQAKPLPPANTSSSQTSSVPGNKP